MRVRPAPSASAPLVTSISFLLSASARSRNHCRVICLRMRTITTTHRTDRTVADTQSIATAYVRSGSFDRSSAARSKETVVSESILAGIPVPLTRSSLGEPF